MPVNRDWLDRMIAQGRVTVKSVNVDTLFGREEDPDVSEKNFQEAVIELAKRNCWKWYHTFDSRKSVSGFPDLVLVRDRVVWAELKSTHGKTDAAQETWLEVLRGAGQEVYVWRPADWPAIVQTLTAAPPPRKSKRGRKAARSTGDRS